MVMTRRQPKTIDPPALPPVATSKRKRSDDATSAPSAAQLPNQSSIKRRKKVKSTAKLDTAPVPTETAPAAQPAKRGGRPISVKAAEHKARSLKAQGKTAVQTKTNGTNLASLRKSGPVDLTDDDKSSEDEASRRSQAVASQDTDGEDADSRYALGSKRKGNSRKPTATTARRTAELKFEEDGFEEVDKAQAAVADASSRRSAQNKKPGPTPWIPINEINAGGKIKENTQANSKGKGKTKQRKAQPAGVPSKVVMFTILEAIAALSLYKDGTVSLAAEIHPESRQPYEPLKTGEYLSYPVKGNYHLGAIGRYGIDAIPPPPFSLTVPLSEYSFIESSHSTSITAPSRHGLGFDTSVPAGLKAPSVRCANNYCFTFGKYRGRRMDSVPISYLRSIFNGDEYHADAKLQQAFADLYPKGLYESEVESYTFEKGGFKGKRLDEVPKSYLWGLVRNKNEGGEVGGKKERGRLERALEVWEKAQLDLTKD